MIVNSLIATVSKYFTSLSVEDMFGRKKVSLIEADLNAKPTGQEVVIDSTLNIDTTYSKQIISHSAESKKVYMDGAKYAPISMTISGYIENSKILNIQEMATKDTWLYVSITKPIGGSISGNQIFQDSKLYTITNLSINEEGYRNSVGVTIQLSEVVLFEYAIKYKYGVKQNNPKGGVKTQKTTGTKLPPPKKTYIRGDK